MSLIQTGSYVKSPVWFKLSDSSLSDHLFIIYKYYVVKTFVSDLFFDKNYRRKQ